MRVDAESLLNKLGREDFAYREFADRFADMELWPIFEALLKDPRLQVYDSETVARLDEARPAVASDGRVDSEPDALPDAAAPATPPAAPVARPAEVSFVDLFGSYDSDAAKQASSQDVRTLLRHLSDLNEKGAL